MNAKQLDLARQLAAHPKYKPEPVTADYVRRLCGTRVIRDTDGKLIPVLTDVATGGVLLDMLGPGASAVRRDRWVVRPGESGWTRAFQGITLAEACARALLAKWEQLAAAPDGT